MYLGPDGRRCLRDSEGEPGHQPTSRNAVRAPDREVSEGFNEGKQVKGASTWTEDQVRGGQGAAPDPFRTPREALNFYDDTGI